MADSENKKTTRRKFLSNIGIIGASSVAGGMAMYAGAKYEKEKSKSRKISALTSDFKLIEVPASEANLLEKAKYNLSELQKRGREGIKGRRWTMVIDLSKCRNARKCMSACQTAHKLHPEQHHINVLQIQEDDQTAPYFMPKPCQHCDNPPCTAVCPVDATFKRQDGIVLIDNQRCIGCRFCVAACPYSARMFHWKEPINSEEDLAQEYDVELNVPQKKGTITKCLFSADKLREGELPYCVSACPNGVYYFGDENEDAVTNGTTKETVQLSKLLKDNGGYTLMPELGTKPRVYYLPAKNRLFDFDENKNNHKA
jgi:molybdopterin-containing oxidoreductase family iron-sulfur binding subunit